MRTSGVEDLTQGATALPHTSWGPFLGRALSSPWGISAAPPSSDDVETVHFLEEWPHHGAQYWLVKFTTMSPNEVT